MNRFLVFRLPQLMMIAHPSQPPTDNNNETQGKKESVLFQDRRTKQQNHGTLQPLFLF
jgi:hypothetical protein